MKRMDRPKKFNVVSVLIGLGLLAGVYALFQFVPPYWRKWKVKEVLSEACTHVYKKRFRYTPEEREIIARETTGRLKALGINDANLRVNPTIKGNDIIVSATYQELVKHPLVNKTTVLRFRPFATMALKSKQEQKN